MKRIILLLSILFVVSLSVKISAQPEIVDSTFNKTDIGFANGDVAYMNKIYATAIQKDGKIIIGGNFKYYNGIDCYDIVRLNIDGSLDTTFKPEISSTQIIYSIALQDDGKIVIGGYFSFTSGIYKYQIVRLNPDGSNDITFKRTEANGRIRTITLQNNGKIIVGGDFTSYDGVTCNHIVRLNSNGVIDSSFLSGSGTNGLIKTTAIQTDGNILIGGNFTSYNGTSINKIARLLSNGSIDTLFYPGNGTVNAVDAIVLQKNGKIIIGGDFNYINEFIKTGVVRLNSNGSYDTLFHSGFGTDTRVSTIAVQSNGDIIVGGDFTTYDTTTRNCLVRLTSDGYIDTSFNSKVFEKGNIYSITIKNDGKIIIGGDFYLFNYNMPYRLVQLESNGTNDVSFNRVTGANETIYTAAVQNDGKIIIGGRFTIFNGEIRNYLARLKANGTLDTTFKPEKGPNDVVYSIVVQEDGKILIGGNFTLYNEVERNYIARLNQDGSLDTTFNSGSGVNFLVFKIALQKDGKILIGGYFDNNGVINNALLRLCPDGSLDTTFQIGSGANSGIGDIVVQSDGKILIGGRFSVFNGNSHNCIIRLNPDGSTDTKFSGFEITSLYSTIFSINLQNDGKILIGGEFSTSDYYQINNIARLNSDGRIDETFNTGVGLDGQFGTCYIQPDGKIIIGGYFTSYDGTLRNNIARLNSDGSIDLTFNNNTGSSGYTSGAIMSIVSQGYGKIIIAGYFTSYNGIGRNRIARLILDESVVSYDEDSCNQQSSLIYPNPVSTELSVKIVDDNEIVNYEVFNSKGQVVLTGEMIGNTKIQTSKLTPGIYFIKLENEHFSEFKKFVKE